MRYAFIFDLDGTLVINKAFKYAIHRIPEELHMNTSASSFYEEFLRTYYYLVSINRVKKAFDWDYVCKLTVERFGFNYEEGLFRDFLLEGIKKGLVDLVNGVPKVLGILKSKGHIIGLLTNGYSWYQSRVLKVTGLDRFFDFTVFLDDSVEPKPSLRAFDYAISLAEGADKIFYVGDHAYYDVYGALRARFDDIFWLTQEISRGNHSIDNLWRILVDVSKRYGKEINLAQLKKKRIIVINKIEEILEHC